MPGSASHEPRSTGAATAAPAPIRILVTGGAGFIGSHLATHLCGLGHRVTALDNCSTGSRANLAHLAGNPLFDFVEADGQLPGVLDVLAGRVDAVVHLAAAVGVQKIIDEPVQTLETNVGFTQTVLAAATRRKLRTLIASSSEVYGRSDAGVFLETDDLLIGPPVSRRWGYAASKLLDEFLALAHHHEYRTPVTVMRLFNTVGPRQTGRYGMVVPRFIDQALKGEALTVYGTGEQRRTFTDVGESVRAMTDLLFCARAAGEVVNIGGRAEVSMNELAALIIRMTGSTSTVRFIPYREAYGEQFEDMQRRNPGTDKLRGLIGWAPDAGIEAILAPIIAAARAPETGGS
jgi:UDP-glucose 4-epimerase